MNDRPEQPASPCLVTGGSGYFGAVLVRTLLRTGHRCRVFDLTDAPDRPEGVDFLRGDIRDADAVARACRGVSVIYHCAAQVAMTRDTQALRSVNIDGTDNVLAAAGAEAVRKIVYVSTSAVYGRPPKNPVTEQMVPEPQDPYGHSKYEAELRCLEAARNGLDVTIVRPTPIIGPERLGIYQILFEWIADGKAVPVLGKGDNRFQMLHADDLAQACLLAGRTEGSDVFNCGAKHFGTLRADIEQLCRHAGTGSRVRSIPRAPAAAAMRIASLLHLAPLVSYHALMYGREFHFDIRHAEDALGWRPEYSTADALIAAYQWYLAHRDDPETAEGTGQHRSTVRHGILTLVGRFL